MPEFTQAQQRAELHKTIWSIADDLRGSVDGWDFKQYILGTLFYRFISESLCEYLNEAEPDPDFNYTKLTDEEAEFGREATVAEKGFFILPSELFQTVRASVMQGAANQNENLEHLNETLERAFKNIEASAIGTESEKDLKGLFDDMDVNSAKLGNTVTERNKKLAKLLKKIGSLDFGGEFKDNRIDAFGDAYEYLMNMYASNAGKSGGEFFTPQDVSELLARITLIGREEAEIKRVYDPCCGSGSLLLKFSKIFGNDADIDYFGQEINLTTYNLCRINMFLHDINFDKFDIALGDTLKEPAHWDYEPFDSIVSNPPYIRKNIINTLDKQVQNEPLIALDGGDDGLDFYKRIISEAPKHLKQHGYLCFEIGYDQKEDVQDLLKCENRYIDIYSKKDLYGNDRIVIAKLKS